MNSDLQPAEQSSAASDYRILVVDDTPSVHDDFRRIFMPKDAALAALDALASDLFESEAPEPTALDVHPSATYRVDHASQGREGLHMVEAARMLGDPYALVFMDIRMPPGWDGIESTTRVIASDPDVQVVLCTAYADQSWREQMARLSARDRVLIVKKPFDVVEVQQLAGALCDKWMLARREREQVVALRKSVEDLAVANDHLRAEMAERARVEERLRMAQRLEGLGRLAAGLGHEINNPLSFIISNTEALQYELEAVGDALPAPVREDITELMRAIMIGSDRISQLVRNIKLFSRQSEAPVEPIDIEEAIYTAMRMVRGRLEPHVDMSVEFLEPARIMGRRIELEQVLINLIDNAAAAMAAQHDRPATIEIRSGREGEGHQQITVADTGPGITPGTMHKIFDPFFTTKAHTKGTGLGLSICHSLVEGMGGTIDVDSSPQGTVFTIRLPVA